LIISVDHLFPTKRVATPNSDIDNSTHSATTHGNAGCGVIGELSDYELIEQGKTYREWCVPSKIVRRIATLSILPS